MPINKIDNVSFSKLLLGFVNIIFYLTKNGCDSPYMSDEESVNKDLDLL